MLEFTLLSSLVNLVNAFSLSIIFSGIFIQMNAQFMTKLVYSINECPEILIYSIDECPVIDSMLLIIVDCHCCNSLLFFVFLFTCCCFRCLLFANAILVYSINKYLVIDCALLSIVHCRHRNLLSIFAFVLALCWFYCLLFAVVDTWFGSKVIFPKKNMFNSISAIIII